MTVPNDKKNTAKTEIRDLMSDHKIVYFMYTHIQN